MVFSNNLEEFLIDDANNRTIATGSEKWLFEIKISIIFS